MPHMPTVSVHGPSHSSARGGSSCKCAGRKIPTAAMAPRAEGARRVSARRRARRGSAPTRSAKKRAAINATMEVTALTAANQARVRMASLNIG